jgi:quinohemoprotein ethanol dehydrogenase
MRAALLCVAGCAAAANGGARAAAPIYGADANWPSHGGGADESGYSRLDGIDLKNIARLGLAWSLDLPGESSLEATPLAIGGVLYFTGSYAAVYAVDGASGKLLWKFDPQTWKYNPLKMNFSFAANRGAAYADGRVYAAALDGRLFALDAKTGRKLWSVETVPANSFQTVTGAPCAADGLVVIGNGGADMGLRGYVTAYDAATGRQVWRFYTAPGAPEQNKGDPAMERAAATWSGKYWQGGTGGGVWDGISFDPELHRFYIGTGNAGPYDPNVRSPGGGDNLYTASIVALDAKTGHYVWHYQVNPRDSWDFDATQGMILAELDIAGVTRKVLMQAPKNGFFYVIDRVTGKPISAAKFGKATWADHIDMTTGRPVEAAGIRYDKGDAVIWPSPTGAHSWQAMAFSPETGLVYIPTMQVGTRFSRGRPVPGAVSVGGVSISDVKADARDGRGALLAWDPVKQEARWNDPHNTFWNGGVLATAGGLVFQGAADGKLAAYDAASGKRLWQFDAGLGIIAPPMSYAADGRQYVSILVGYGGAAAMSSELSNVGWKYDAPRRLLTFVLDGRAKLPPAAPPNRTVKAVDDPNLVINPADVAMGKAIYIACGACHGRDLVSAGGPAPDLRESRVALDPVAFRSVVQGGALIEHGMPRFTMLSGKQIDGIWAYIRQGARDARAARK